MKSKSIIRAVVKSEIECAQIVIEYHISKGLNKLEKYCQTNSSANFYDLCCMTVNYIKSCHTIDSENLTDEECRKSHETYCELRDSKKMSLDDMTAFIAAYISTFSNTN